MENAEENQGLLSDLMCYLDAVFIDWDDLENQGTLMDVFRSITESLRWPQVNQNGAGF